MMKIILKKRLFAYSLLSIFVVLTVFVVCYVSRINIYEPFIIEFSGISKLEEKNIQLYSVSPLNRELFVENEGTERGWNSYNSYHQKIGMIVPDSLVNKIYSISVIINQKTVSLKN